MLHMMEFDFDAPTYVNEITERERQDNMIGTCTADEIHRMKRNRKKLRDCYYGTMMLPISVANMELTLCTHVKT